MRKATEATLCEFLVQACEDQGEFVDEYNETRHITSYRSYREAGVLTDNEGLVIRLSDGTEFQVTIHKC